MFTIFSKVPLEPHLPEVPKDLRGFATRLEDVLREHAIAINGGDAWEDLRFGSNSIVVDTIGAVAAPTRDNVEASFPGTLLFSGTQDNIAAGTFQMPHSWKAGSEIMPHIHWTKPAGGVGDDVTWQLYYRFFNLAASPGAWIGPLAGTLAVNHGGIAEAEAITNFPAIDMSTMKISGNVAWRLYRRGAADAFGGTARLIEFDIHYVRDASGSASEFVK